MSATERGGPTGRRRIQLARGVRIAILALRAAIPGAAGRDPRAVKTPLEMAQREAVAAGLLPGQDDDTLVADARLMRRMQDGWRVLCVGIWLVYLIPTLKDAWHAPDVGRRVVGTGAVMGFCLVYLLVFISIRRFRLHLLVEPSTGRAWSVLLVGVGLILLAVPAAGESALALCIYLAVLMMFLLPRRQAAVSVIATAGTVALLSNVVPGWDPANLLSMQILISAVAIWGIIQLLQRNNQLAQAREEITSLAVSQERLRFSRDLHDILGHSLTVITVKAELAGRLIHVDAERAEREIAEVEQLARTALADVRSTASGYRNLSLAAELASARTALDAAGIEAELAGAVADVPPERLELFGWAVREGVTNVVRHSGARHCRVTVDPTQVEIIDDGTGSDRTVVGNGLTGLRERAEAAGAQLWFGGAGHGGGADRGGGADQGGGTDQGGFRLRVGW
jgi:two-component system, NarL family, sensor histidine kinase DesK